MTYDNPFAPPARKGMSTGLKATLIIAGLLVLLCGGGAVACTALAGGAATSISNEMDARKGDVRLMACHPRGTIEGTWEARIEITNSGKTDHTYLVQINLMDGNKRLGEAHAVVNDLAPGQTARERVVGLTGGGYAAAKCEVGDVN